MLQIQAPFSRPPWATILFTLLACASPMFGVDFATEVHPILAARCVSCHHGGSAPAGLSFASRDLALKGGVSGPAFSPGDSAHSLMILKVTHQKGALMPASGEPLTAAQIGVLKAWIDEGAVWPDTKSAAAADAGKWVAPIAPRQPPIPDQPFANPVDRFVAAYLAKNNVKFAAPVSDEAFAHRVYLDVWGVPPTAAEVEQFLANRDPHKREELVDALIGNQQRYAGNWISWWNDLLRNDTGVNYAGDRKSITPWLHQTLEHNTSYDQMIASLINPVKKDDPDGFLVGVNWRGTVNASQTPYMQAAQNTGQVFLGINLKCASCHDSFVNRYKLRESYGMAALFSPDAKLELVRCDVKQGKFVTPALLYPELGSVPENASLEERHAAAARFFTDPRNGRVPRTIVNRYWGKLFGRGLVEPVDEMDSKPWDPDLLDWMAFDFSAHGSDLHYLLRELLTSRAYQMPSIPAAEQPDKTYAFRGPLVRRISAEEFADTLSLVTGEWGTRKEGKTAVQVRDWELKSSPLALALGRPVRDQVFTTRDNHATTFQALELVNGSTFENRLRRGALRMIGQLPAAPANLFDSGTLHHGSVPFDIDISGTKRLFLLTQDAGAYDPARTIAGWSDVELSGPGGTKKLSELTTLSKFEKRNLTVDKKLLSKTVTLPLNTRLVYPIEGLGFTRLRGRVAIDDSSEPSDVGGAVRFFVFNSEPDPERLIKVEGDAPFEAPPRVTNVDEAVNNLYLTLFSRQPSPDEKKVALAFFEQPGESRPELRPPAVEDFLWSMMLHPDFQYVY